MAGLVSIYVGDPTEGGTDGTVVSTNQAFSSPIQLYVNAAQSTESVPVKCAIRTSEGYSTRGTTTLRDYNDAYDRIRLCKTPDGEFTDSISFSEPITAVNTIFYVKAYATATDYNQTDRSVSLFAEYELTTV